MIENIKATECGITLKKSEIFGIKLEEVFLYKEIAYIDFNVLSDNKNRITGASLMIKKSNGDPKSYISSLEIKNKKIKINNLISDWKEQILKNIPPYYLGWISMENSGPKQSLYRFVIFDPERVISLEGSGKKIVLGFPSRFKNMNNAKIIETPQAFWWWNGTTCRKSTVEKAFRQCSDLINEKYKTKETNNMKKTLNANIAVKQTEMPQERVFVATMGWIYITGEKTRIHRNKCSDMIGFQGIDGNYYEVAENLIKVYVKENYNSNAKN